MTTIRSASDQIIDEVCAWPDVEAAGGSRGELSIRHRRKEIGHLHGDRVLHIGFPKAVWHELHDEGRIDYHPVFPGKPGFAARKIETQDDVRDVIALLRLNYDRAVGRARAWESPVAGLYASTPAALPFAPSHEVRAFLLRRARGNLLLYSVDGLGAERRALDAVGGVSRHYLNHRHEAMFAADAVAAPRFVHEHERAAVQQTLDVRATFSRRHRLDDDFEVIPTPGHTSGATAFLWDSGEHRFLFTGDTVYLDDGEWVAAVLASSDRVAYLESLELLRDLDFDVLVPWAASAGQPYVAVTSGADARRRLEAVHARVAHGADR